MKDVETIPQILVSKMICPDGTVLRSRHRHDYQEHTDADGNWSMLDGGLAYVRYSGVGELLTVMVGDPHELIREHFDWGSYGKNGDEPLKYSLLKDLEDTHIQAILRTQTRLSSHIIKVFEDEMEYRSNNALLL